MDALGNVVSVGAVAIVVTATLSACGLIFYPCYILYRRARDKHAEAEAQTAMLWASEQRVMVEIEMRRAGTAPPDEATSLQNLRSDEATGTVSPLLELMAANAVGWFGESGMTRAEIIDRLGADPHDHEPPVGGNRTTIGKLVSLYAVQRGLRLSTQRQMMPRAWVINLASDDIRVTQNGRSYTLSGNRTGQGKREGARL